MSFKDEYNFRGSVSSILKLVVAKIISLTLIKGAEKIDLLYIKEFPNCCIQNKR